MKIHCQYSSLEPIDSIKPHPKNRNIHPQTQIDLLAKIIKHHGFRHPIIVSEQSGFIVAGHARALAAKQLGLELVPVVKQSFDSPSLEYSFMTSDNTIQELSKLDKAGVNLDIGDFGPELDLEMLAIPDFTVEPLDSLDLTEEPKVVTKCETCGQKIKQSKH
jgi:hypothetical protein